MSISVAIVIPVYREGSYIETTLRSIEKSVQYSIEKQWIPKVVLVVNNPVSVSDAFRKDNKLIIQNVRDLSDFFSYPIDVLDYTEPGLNNGVGEARKIGMNYAISKYLKNPHDLIASLDADCTVDLNYVSTLFNAKITGSGMALYFEHALDSTAIVLYELYLRYLRWGLLQAQSPFAFYAVGSCMVTTMKNYEKVGGMVSKSATEDFHFMNKLRKYAHITYCTETTVHPSTRLSQRVTLGTGYFLTDAKVNFDKAFQLLMMPSPAEFKTLGTILKILNEFEGGSLSDRFKDEGLESIYKDMHERGLIRKIYGIFESTSNSKTYRERLREVIDGLETLRILRNMWQIRTKNQKETFLDWCRELWQLDEKDPEKLLMAVRETEKSTVFVDV